MIHAIKYYNHMSIDYTFCAAPASPPENVNVVNISSTAIRVSWDPVPLIDQNGVITQYEVEYNQTTFSEVSMYNTTTVNSTTLMVDLTGLEEYVVYSIRVRAYTSVGAGPYSDVVMERTQQDGMYASIVLPTSDLSSSLVAS